MSSTAQHMDRFLADVEKQAYLMAQMSVKNPDDALDIVQESMMTLVSKYSNKPVDQWRPLFFRILQNRTRDFHRRASTRGRVFSLFGAFRRNDDEEIEFEDLHAGRESDQPEQRSVIDDSRDEMLVALSNLPERQRQAFALRAIEGMGVADTARAMGCSAGSVKTHYSRAVHRLRDLLQEHWK